MVSIPLFLFVLFQVADQRLTISNKTYDAIKTMSNALAELNRNANNDAAATTKFDAMELEGREQEKKDTLELLPLLFAVIAVSVDLVSSAGAMDLGELDVKNRCVSGKMDNIKGQGQGGEQDVTVIGGQMMVKLERTPKDTFRAMVRTAGQLDYELIMDYEEKSKGQCKEAIMGLVEKTEGCQLVDHWVHDGKCDEEGKCTGGRLRVTCDLSREQTVQEGSDPTGYSLTDVTVWSSEGTQCLSVSAKFTNTDTNFCYLVKPSQVPEGQLKETKTVREFSGRTTTATTTGTTAVETTTEKYLRRCTKQCSAEGCLAICDTDEECTKNCTQYHEECKNACMAEPEKPCERCKCTEHEATASVRVCNTNGTCHQASWEKCAKWWSTVCTRFSTCFKDQDCGETGFCEGDTELGTCDCTSIDGVHDLACIQEEKCHIGKWLRKERGGCGGLEGACNTTSNLCDCEMGFRKAGYNGTADAVANFCNKKQCDGDPTDDCFGFPCNSGLCICGSKDNKKKGLMSANVIEEPKWKMAKVQPKYNDE